MIKAGSKSKLVNIEIMSVVDVRNPVQLSSNEEKANDEAANSTTEV